MLKLLITTLAFSSLLILCGCDSENSRSIVSDLILWYKTPASQWKESLPIGNGSLGAMIQGGVFADTMVINEETLWSGGPNDYSNPGETSKLEFYFL